MGKRDDIHKVLIIGSGPIVIGQACEFDYSGTQACKALRELGYKIVLVNSNPATIMTDPGMADATYIEPLNVRAVTEIIEKERPDALLPNLGGQTALNLATDLHKEGVLEKYGVKVIGVNIDAIERGEDRIAFKETMNRLGIEMPRSTAVYNVPDAEKVAGELGYPVVIRPAYTMGGTGGGLVYNVEELRTVAARGLAASRISQVLVEESVLGWEELELEVVRDAKGRMITVCFIENVDAMGVHTGDSFCTAPMLTIDAALQKRLQEYSYRIVDGIEVIGGTNVQFAHDPATGRVVVIEINPRTSRSSALASKATGFPIALVSAKLAAGLTLDEIPYWRDGTLDKYTPSGDYVVVKFARWAFEKFHGAVDKLGTQMRAVGEAMSIGKNYKEAFQKAIRSLEIGRYGLGFAKDFHEKPLDELMNLLAEPSSERQFIMYEALRKGATVEALHEKTYIKAWFIEQMKQLVELEEKILACKGKDVPDELLIQAKKDGFADKYLAKLMGVAEKDIRARRIGLGVVEAWEPVPVSGVENAAYYFSTYNAPDKVSASDRRKVMVLGGGPNRIGQGIEFDYCCVHAAFTARDAGLETIMVNCNPETVSTDYDTSDKLYFEPLTVEDVLSIYEKENGKALKPLTTESTENTEKKKGNRSSGPGRVVDLSGDPEHSCLSLSHLEKHREHVLKEIEKAAAEHAIGDVGIVLVAVAQEVETVYAADRKGKCWAFGFLWQSDPPALASVHEEQRDQGWDWLSAKVVGNEVAERINAFLSSSASSVPSAVKSDGLLEGVIVQFGGQTPLNIAAELEAAGVKILGTSPATIALAEDRDLFRGMMDKLGVPMPASDMASNLDEALAAAGKIGYPLMLRPSYVLGGRGMEIIHDENMLRRYVSAAVGVTPERPILIDKFLDNALEVEADAISDGTDVFIPAIMEHIELAGVHSGDSACMIPSISIPQKHLATIGEYTRRIARELGVVGLMNMQYAIADDVVYVLEANPRASRTVPLVSKVCGIPMARVATQVMLGKKIPELNLKQSEVPHYGVKEAVFPFSMFPEVDPVLGPEMRSTGEVLGMADNFGLAFFKSQEGADQTLPAEGTVLITVSRKERPEVLDVARGFAELGFRIKATEGTCRFLTDSGIECELIRKLHEGRPNIVDGIMNGEIHLVINTPIGRLSQIDDSYIRKTAVKYRVPYITTLAAALAAAKGIAAYRKGRGGVKSLQSYHKDIK